MYIYIYMKYFVSLKKYMFTLFTLASFTFLIQPFLMRIAPRQFVQLSFFLKTAQYSIVCHPLFNHPLTGVHRFQCLCY